MQNFRVGGVTEMAEQGALRISSSTGAIIKLAKTESTF